MAQRPQIYLAIAVVGALAMASANPAQASNNTVLGTGAGASLGPDAHSNTLLGENAGHDITNGDENTLVGREAGWAITLGGDNNMVGESAGRNTITASGNTFLGAYAGLSSTLGTFNTYLGQGAGTNNQAGYRNVFVGYQAGSNELGFSKLYIENSTSSAPLIYGEFAPTSPNLALVGINGALGVGTQIPMDQLHVRDGNLRIEQTGATHAILNFIANGKSWEIKNNEATGRLTFFSPGGGATTSPFKFDRQAVENLLRVGVLAANTVDINGNLVVLGFINPDYVFTPAYPLETIEAHAAYMWKHRHLPAVGPGEVNAQGQAMVNVGRRSQGMLEELELAHIYIDQLHGEMTQNEAELAALQADRAHKEKQIAALTKEVTALKLYETELAALESQMAEKEARLDQLQGKIAALKTLVHQLMGQGGSGAPREQG